MAGDRCDEAASDALTVMSVNRRAGDVRRLDRRPGRLRFSSASGPEADRR